jgi:hypothetical protein
MISSIEAACDQLKKQNVYIPRYVKMYRGIVAIIKFVMTIGLVLFVIAIAIAMIYFVNAGQFGFVLVLTVIFLIFATIMNRVIDRYGD